MHSSNGLHNTEFHTNMYLLQCLFTCHSCSNTVYLHIQKYTELDGMTIHQEGSTADKLKSCEHHMIYSKDLEGDESNPIGKCHKIYEE